jgi:Protein of unknown function (DUF642)
MILLSCGRYSLGIGLAVAMLAGCGGSQGQVGGTTPLAATASRERMDSGSYGYCPALPGGTGILPDGDFSQEMNPGDHNITPKKGAVFAPDWVVSKGNIDFNGTTYWDMDGLCSVDLDGYLTVGGIKSSAFPAKRGTYSLSFVMSGNGHCSPTIKTMKISIDNQFTTFTWNTASGNDVQNGDYAVETWQFHANQLSTLKLVSQDPKGSGCGVVIAGMAITKS